MTSRQVRRLCKAYVRDGATGLVSKRRGRRSNRRLSEDLQKRAVEIIRELYADFGPTLAREKLMWSRSSWAASGWPATRACAGHPQPRPRRRARAPGVGKTFVGAALAQAACRAGMRALCTRVPRLLHGLGIARADGSYAAALARLAKLDVLILDDFLIGPLKDQERRDLVEILEDRYGKSSTVVTTQVPTKNWHEQLSDPTMADAICDRVIHNAHVLALPGPSIREKKGMLTTQNQPTT